MKVICFLDMSCHMFCRDLQIGIKVLIHRVHPELSSTFYNLRTILTFSRVQGRCTHWLSLQPSGMGDPYNQGGFPPHLKHPLYD